ncbi:MAG TPA: TonB-dependent receptor [Balneolaceae bacterium]|nr:TonB-dependent receptor [Balneolaceae bacterium]
MLYKNITKGWILLFSFLFIATAVQAQQKKVQGVVKGAQNGKPLPGVNIKVKGTTTGSITNNKGHYTLNAPSQKDTLIFSYIGYKQKTVPIQGRSTINVQLKSTTVSGQQMVVVGYSKEKKQNVTGAVSTVSGKNLSKAPVPNVSNSIGGQVPGVIANNRSGEPGNNASTILIRGRGTLNNNSPLYVIDGVQSSFSAFNELNPSDIKSISVLKGASAAIYGSEAANGVIVVTTKNGKKGPPTFHYNGRFGESQPTRIPRHLNGWQFMKWRDEGDSAASQPLEYSKKTIQALKNGTYNPRQYGNTDWERAILKQYSPTTQHQLSVSGGTDVVTYSVSGQYEYQDGIFKQSATYYHQGNLRANIGIQATKNLHISLKSNGVLKRKHYSNISGTGIFDWAKNEYPFLPVFFPNGKPSGSQGLVNPLLMANGTTGFNKQRFYTFNNNLSFDLKLPEITPGLYLQGRADFDIEHWDTKLFTDRFHMYSYDPTTDTYIDQYSSETSGNGFATPMSMNETYNKSFNKILDLQLGYKHSFGYNNLSAFVAYEEHSYDHRWISAYRQGLLSDQIVQLSLGSSQLLNNNGNMDHSAKRDMFGRLTYNYKQKYLVNFIIRHDGSYRFPPGHRWGTFPSISVGWRISNEPFFKNNISFISDLKLKASWGKLGNSQIAPYQFLTSYSFGSGYNLGVNPTHYRGLVPGVAPNPNITWEVARKRDVGLNAQFFGGSLSLDADYFFDKRNNILVHPNANVPSYTGLQVPDENIGKVKNHGIDGAITYQHNSESFNYQFSGNFTFARNKVVYMDEPKNIPSYQRITGHPMNSWLVYKADGIYQNKQQINNSPHPPGTQIGDVKYVDVNGDGKITPADRVRIFQSPTPKIQWGFSMRGGYKGFEAYLLWRGQAEAKQLISPGSFHTPPLWRFTERWTPSHRNTSIPRAITRNNTVDNRPSTVWLKSSRYLRLKTVRLSYTLPAGIVKAFSISRALIYVSGQNLFFISPIKHYDPEITATNGQYYPQVREYSVGISLSF